MVESAKLHRIGLNQEKEDTMTLILSKKLKKKSELFNNIWPSLNLVRKVMLTKEGNPLFLRLVTVYLKVSPMKKVQRFGVKRKLMPRYVVPYRIIERKGLVTYKLQLPKEMNAIFLVFHVSQLKKCLCVPEERVETQNIKLASDLVYEKLVQILDSKERETRSKTIKLYKVLWSNHDERDVTWETEAYQKEVYSNFYNKWLVTQNLKTRFF
jgi:hypothetical protein